MMGFLQMPPESLLGIFSCLLPYNNWEEKLIKFTSPTNTIDIIPLNPFYYNIITKYYVGL